MAQIVAQNPLAAAGLGALQAEAAAPAPVDNIVIAPTESGMSFIVTGLAKGSPLKAKIKALGGARNARVKGYVFPARDLNRVCNELGVAQGVNLVDPRQTIEVVFTDKVQWNGPMENADALLKGLGMTKKNGKGNVWVGDLAMSQRFAAAMNVTTK